MSKEHKWDKLGLRAAKRAWGFEERLREGRGSAWVRRCLKKIEWRSETGKEKSRWERERRLYVEKKRVRLREINEKRGNEEVWGKIEWKEKKRQKKERVKKIRKAKYNGWCKAVMENQIPRYISERRKEERWRRVARFRMGNEMKKKSTEERGKAVQGIRLGERKVGTCVREM